eukprot:TRINITY_DN75439_c0_g1_i1.p1 TRINITY_DN75439_c0_g1~~TRINITY_DN75439_c0_g1_i1.p1  ORF type:complete len:255 (-),score=49.87 TRINITY_DN75439_c0_g1_i1:113-877(-)
MNLNDNWATKFCSGVSDKSVRISPSTATVPSGTMDEAPISKTMQYKKITKPLLERKRRARINSYLDELKDIMTGCLQAEGENVSKLEKADILELTVRHLQKLSQAQRLVLNRSPVEDIARFRHGYSSCAQEAAQFLVSVPGVDVRVGQRLMQQLLGQPQPQPQAPPIQQLVQQRMLSTLLLSSQSHLSPLPPSPPATSPPRLSPTSLHPSQTGPSFPLTLSPPDTIKPWPLKPAARRIAVTSQAAQEPVWKPYS